MTSIACFTAALLLPYAAAQSVIPVATAALLAKAALSVTYLLSGLPQLAETVYAAVAGKIDTHVLMSLSVLGTLYMGMAQEVSLAQQWPVHQPCFRPACWQLMHNQRTGALVRTRLPGSCLNN